MDEPVRLEGVRKNSRARARTMGNRAMRSMDCTDIKVLLSGLVDDEVDGETRHTAERHIAECTTCRDLIDQAEALNALIVSDATSAVDGGLPPDLVGNVLSRTVRAEPVHADHRRGPHGITSWLGWLAAAAALLFTFSSRLMNGSSTPARTALAPAPSQVARDTARDTSAGDPTARDAFARSNKVTEQSTVRTASYIQSSIYEGNVPPFLDSGAEPAGMLREDAEAFDSTSLVLEMLIEVDLEDADRLREIREIADYDELLPRLAAARERLDAQDQIAVLTAETALVRLLEGPLTPANLEDLRSAVRRSDLHGQLSRLSARWDRTHRI